MKTGSALVAFFFTALVGVPALAGDEVCPIDKTIFLSESGRAFMAQRVAAEWQFYCPKDDQLHSYDPANPDATKDCQGPYGTTIIEGLLDGEKVSYVKQVNDGVPCCFTTSYKGGAEGLKEWKLVKGWLKPEEAYKVTLTKDTVGQQPTPMAFDSGPIGKEVFTATSCLE